MKIININDCKFSASQDYTILQIMIIKHMVIPRFCYHEQLSIAGNCRICLIEDIKSLKPIIACGMNIYNEMSLYSDTIKVKKAREAVIEFLLINHPLDCPICDQGGECDLQDITMLVGSDRGRFYENKRAVLDKNFGFLIKTVMNRCIHCTRCVRFASEIIGFDALGVLGRGMFMEIGFYIDTIFEYGVSGNVVDLCPVGALTAKPYAFTFRSWELKKNNCFDFFDYLLSQILIETRWNNIMRILPYYDYDIGFGFISDKTRFCFDSIKHMRNLFPYVSIAFKKCKFSWEMLILILKKTYINVLNFLIKNKLKYIAVYAYVGEFLDYNSITLLKYLVAAFGSAWQSSYVLSQFCNFELENDLKNITNKNFLLLNLNIRILDPLLNIRMRKSITIS